MPKVECRDCQRRMDARSASLCPDCHSYLCEDCTQEHEGRCNDCHQCVSEDI